MTPVLTLSRRLHCHQGPGLYAVLTSPLWQSFQKQSSYAPLVEALDWWLVRRTGVWGFRGSTFPRASRAMMPLSAEEWRDSGPEMGSLRECLGAGCPHLDEKNNKCLRDTFHIIMLSCRWPYKELRKTQEKKERYPTECRVPEKSKEKAFISEQSKEIEGKTGDLIKKIRDTKGIFHAKTGTIKERNGKDQTEEIKKRWQEYIEELYKKYLHNLDNHDN